MTTTVTLNLPDDAIVSEAIDPQSNTSYLNLTISQSHIPFLVKFLLNGMTQNGKNQLSMEQKEALANAIGLKNIYRFPSLLRTLALGAASGIALKTFASQMIQIPVTGSNPVLAHAGVAANLVVEGVRTYPYTAAISLAGVSMASKLTVKSVVSSMQKTASAAKKCFQFCIDNPKTTIALTASVPLSVVVWLKTAEIKDVCKIAYSMIASAISRK